MTDSAGAGAGRIMALDYGTRRIGVALSDPLGLTAGPLLTLVCRSWRQDIATLVDLARQHEVTRIVVGWPLAMDGSRTERVRLTEIFMQRVGRATGLPVEPWDERLTSVQAERVLIESGVRRDRRREVKDQVAAVILLQSYLDAAHAGGPA